MATYIIGDVQGCYTELQQLLTLVNFNPIQDRLGFVGDLVNRGPDSLLVLRFIKSLPRAMVVLGNHDLHLLAIGYQAVAYSGKHTLDAVLNATDKIELLDWLRNQPFLHFIAEFDAILVHAGIPPQWTLPQALREAEQVAGQLRGPHYLDFLQHMYGHQPMKWQADLIGWDRSRYVVNAFTRMRFCTQDGELDLANKTVHSSNPERFRPWFDWYQLPERVLFGHWAALEGHCSHPNCEALDTGCAWGHALTAYRLEDQRRFSVSSILSNFTARKE